MYVRENRISLFNSLLTQALMLLCNYYGIGRLAQEILMVLETTAEEKQQNTT